MNAGSSKPCAVPRGAIVELGRRLGAAGVGWLSSGGWALCWGLVLWLGTGCRVVESTVDVPAKTLRTLTPGQKEGAVLDPVQLQATLLRFGDEFSKQAVVALDALARGAPTLEVAALLQWKIGLVGEICSIVSGPNAVAGLLDMTVFVTVLRTAVEARWGLEEVGEAARPLQESCRRAETEIWRLAGVVLDPAQQAELREAVAAWQRQNLLPESALGARAAGFVVQMTRVQGEGAAKPGSVFGLWQLNPLSSLDPTTQEIAQARLFSERAIFVAQKLPMLMRWQAELLSLNLGRAPAVEQVLSNATQVAAAFERLAGVAERLPGQVSAERAALIQELEVQERRLTPLVQEVREALTAGSQMSTSLTTTLVTFDALMERFGVGETNTPPSSGAGPAEPFRIQDYAATAAQLEATARRLTELIRVLDQAVGSTNLSRLAAQVGPAVHQAQTGGKEVVDYAFGRALLLVGVVFLAALAYRFLAGRIGLVLMGLGWFLAGAVQAADRAPSWQVVTNLVVVTNTVIVTVTNYVVTTNVVVTTNHPGVEAKPGQGKEARGVAPPPDLSWAPPEDTLDWIQLKSGEWLRGRLKGMQDRKLEFDSEKLEDQSFDWKDVRQVRVSRTLDVLFEDGEAVSGAVAITPDEVSVVGEVVRVRRRAELQSLTPGGSRERDHWSGKVSVGLTVRAGNTESVDYGAQAHLERRTPATRFSLDYIGNASTVGGEESARNHRVNGEFDLWLSRRFYLILPFAEYYSDPFQNLDHRITGGLGVGYDLIDRRDLEWTITTGPAYQQAWFDSSQPGEPTEKRAAALAFGSRFDWDITRRVELLLEYRGQYTRKEVGETTHHSVATLSLDLTKRFDLDVSFVWDRISQPKVGADGVEPKPDDFRLVLGLGLDF